MILDSFHQSAAFNETDLNLATILGCHAGGALCYARNLSQAQMRQEEIARDSQKRIEFVAGLVHEVKTPLTVFKGFLELLKEEKLSRDGEKYLELMTRDATRLSRTMNDLLQLARLEAGVRPNEPHFEELKLVLSRMVEHFRRPCIEKGVALELNMGSEKRRAMVEEQKFTQILRNLLDNALKYTEAGGSIAIESFIGVRDIKISVADTGRGIASQDLPYVTNSFYQVRKSGAELKDGVGLGLSIVKRLLDSLGGKLTIESKPEKGSCFSFCLPRVEHVPQRGEQ